MVKIASEIKTLDLYIARHGESARNIAFKDGISRDDFTVEENEDPELTENGLRQAALLGSRLSKGKLDAVFSSPLMRALATANETARQQEKYTAIEIIPELVELNIHKDFVPKKLADIKARFPNAEIYKDSPCDDILSVPVGEWSKEENHLRAQKIIDYIRQRFFNGEKVLLVAHGGFNTCLIRAALGFDFNLPFGFCQHNTALTKIKFYDDGHCRVGFINDTSHLFAKEDMISFTE